MSVPGIVTSHQIITPNCVQAQGGEMEALEVAFERIRKEYELCSKGSLQL